MKVTAYQNDQTKMTLPPYRQPDFSGLFWETGTLYAVSKNGYAICKLAKTITGYEEQDIWSFEKIETKEEFRYQFMMFGRAEGLCMDEEKIYVILDNNGHSRQGDPDDRRPLLFVMVRP